MFSQTICQKAGKELVLFFAKEFHKLVPMCVRFGVNQYNAKSRVCFVFSFSLPSKRRLGMTRCAGTLSLSGAKKKVATNLCQKTFQLNFFLVLHMIVKCATDDSINKRAQSSALSDSIGLILIPEGKKTHRQRKPTTRAKLYAAGPCQRANHALNENGSSSGRAPGPGSDVFIGSRR